MINPTNLKPEEIIKTMWFVFGMDTTYDGSYGTLTEENAVIYLFEKVLPAFENHGYVLKKSKSKKLNFGNIEEDFKNMKLFNKQSANVDKNVIDWLKESEHYPKVLKSWSNLADVNMGIYLSDASNKNIISPRASLILLCDYFLWYMGMCGFKLTKIKGKEDTLFILKEIYHTDKMKRFEMILNVSH